MNYGLYLSASGALASMHRQDVMASNLANINTVGFKPSDVTLAGRLPERLSPGPITMLADQQTAPTDSQLMLEQLGGGLFAAPSRVDLRQGALEQTGNDLDLAIEGEGFFLVNAGNGAANATRFTRDGRLTLNAAGELVMTAGGHPVLDVEDQPIVLDRAQPITIDGRGNITQGGEVVATIQIATVRELASLVKDGDNLLRPGGTPRAAQRIAAGGVVQQRHVETSAVDPVLALNALINASKAVQANLTMMQYHDNILGQVINTYGRVA